MSDLLFSFQNNPLIRKNLLIYKSYKHNFTSEDFAFYKTCKIELKKLGFSMSKYNNLWSFNLFIKVPPNHDVTTFHFIIKQKNKKIARARALYDIFN